MGKLNQVIRRDSAEIMYRLVTAFREIEKETNLINGNRSCVFLQCFADQIYSIVQWHT